MGVLYRSIAELLGPSWNPRCVCLEHRPPHGPTIHKTMFGGTVEFNADFNGIVCATHQLSSPLPPRTLAWRSMRAASWITLFPPPAKVRRITFGELSSRSCQLAVARRTKWRRRWAWIDVRAIGICSLKERISRCCCGRFDQSLPLDILSIVTVHWQKLPTCSGSQLRARSASGLGKTSA